jgi:hypothetical protein
MNAAEIYQKEVHKRGGFFGTWLPGDHLRLGDVGKMSDGKFTYLRSLGDLGMEPTLSGWSPGQSASFTSHAKISTEVNTETKASGVGSASLRLSLGRDGSFVFEASELRHRRIEQRLKVRDFVVSLYKKGKWSADWLLVDGLHQAACATIVVANGAAAEVILDADTVGPIDVSSLANGAIKFVLRSTSSAIEKVISGKDVHPLFSCLRLSRSWLGRPVDMEAARGPGDALDDAFERVAPGDVWPASPSDVVAAGPSR